MGRAGNFSEYYFDMDCIIEDQLWTPETLEGAWDCTTGARPHRRPSLCPRIWPP
jgi:hypothetical protein